jgi:hypothetical protein
MCIGPGLELHTKLKLKLKLKLKVYLAQPTDVGGAMKASNAVVYHLPTGEYRLATRAHRTALRERWNLKG